MSLLLTLFATFTCMICRFMVTVRKLCKWACKMKGQASVNASSGSWYETAIEYAGQGRAAFADPAGIVVGSATARFEDNGTSTIQMTIQNIESAFEPISSRDEFFQPGPYHEHDGVRSWEFGEHNRANSCTGVTIDTPVGRWESTGDIVVVDWQGGRVVLRVTQARFDALDAGAAEYWVLPLINFVSRFARHDGVAEHPLRFRNVARKSATLGNPEPGAPIQFTCKSEPAFIQPLAEYGARVARLKDGSDRSLATAVMIGSTTGDVPDEINVRQWPLTLLVLPLGLATGSEVSVPWAEFRDAKGGLVRRIHFDLGQPIFIPGHPTFDEPHHNGTGELLTAALAASCLADSRLHSALLNTVRGRRRGRTLEERLSYLVRAVDSLAARAGLDKPLALEGKISEVGLSQATAVVASTVSAIRRLAAAESSGPVPSGQAILERIAARIDQQMKVRRGFGEIVGDLLHKYGLSDAVVAGRYYGNTSDPQPKNLWLEKVGYCRNTVAHGRSFDFGPGGRDDIREVGRITDHLHDILVRILLKELGYRGFYQPTIIKMIVHKRIDWVTAELSPEELGYR